MDNQNMQTMEEKLIKELKITRIFCVISCLLTVGLLVGGFLVFKQVQPMFQMVEKIGPAMEQLMGLDVEAFNDAIQGLDTEAISKAVENLNKASETMEKFGNVITSIF